LECLGGVWTEYLGTPNVELIECVRGLRSRCRLGILSNSFEAARAAGMQAHLFEGNEQTIARIAAHLGDRTLLAPEGGPVDDGRAAEARAGG